MELPREHSQSALDVYRYEKASPVARARRSCARSQTPRRGTRTRRAASDRSRVRSCCLNSPSSGRDGVWGMPARGAVTLRRVRCGARAFLGGLGVLSIGFVATGGNLGPAAAATVSLTPPVDCQNADPDDFFDEEDELLVAGHPCCSSMASRRAPSSLPNVRLAAVRPSRKLFAVAPVVSRWSTDSINSQNSLEWVTSPAIAPELTQAQSVALLQRPGIRWSSLPIRWRLLPAEQAQSAPGKQRTRGGDHDRHPDQGFRWRWRWPTKSRSLGWSSTPALTTVVAALL